MKLRRGPSSKCYQLMGLSFLYLILIVYTVLNNSKFMTNDENMNLFKWRQTTKLLKQKPNLFYPIGL